MRCDRTIFGEIRGASARQILLVLGTLFIHSFPEGVVSELIPEGLEGGDRLEIGVIVAIGFLLMMLSHTLL